MFSAFLDDCGTHDGAPVVAVAGYAGYTYEWERLERDWNEFLAREGIRYYHAVEAAQGRKEFAGRDKSDRQRVHREAVQIITRYELLPVSFSIDGPWFRGRFPDAVPFGGKVIQNSALCYCFQRIAYRLAEHVAGIEATPVAIVMEESPGNMGDLMNLFEAFVTHPPYAHYRHCFQGPPTFRPKIGYPQLQAADVLAYETVLDLQRNWDPNRQHGPRESYKALSQHAAANSGYLMHVGPRRDELAGG